MFYLRRDRRPAGCESLLSCLHTPAHAHPSHALYVVSSPLHTSAYNTYVLVNALTETCSHIARHTRTCAGTEKSNMQNTACTKHTLTHTHTHTRRHKHTHTHLNTEPHENRQHRRTHACAHECSHAHTHARAHREVWMDESMVMLQIASRVAVQESCRMESEKNNQRWSIDWSGFKLGPSCHGRLSEEWNLDLIFPKLAF